MNLLALPPDRLPQVLAEFGLTYAKLADGREWVRADHLGHVDAGVKRGMEADLASAIAAMTDEGTREFVARVGDRGVRTPEFRAALVDWVRERLTRGLPIPDSVHREWKPR